LDLFFRTWLHGLFATLVAEVGYRDAGQLTAQLVILYDGANISAQMDRNPATAAAARDAAAVLLNMARNDPHEASAAQPPNA
jgi:hypothetical protein